MTSISLTLLIGVAGGIGSAFRLVVDRIVSVEKRQRFPWGTNIVNITGSFALGYVAEVSMTSGTLRSILAVGLLGGFTTFSTASLETVVLGAEHRSLPALANSLGMLVMCVLAAVSGMSLAG